MSILPVQRELSCNNITTIRVVGENEKIVMNLLRQKKKKRPDTRLLLKLCVLNPDREILALIGGEQVVHAVDTPFSWRPVSSVGRVSSAFKHLASQQLLFSCLPFGATERAGKERLLLTCIDDYFVVQHEQLAVQSTQAHYCCSSHLLR